MNMLGHLGGSIAPGLTGVLLTVTGNRWNIAFYLSAVIYAAGALCWSVIDPMHELDLDPS
jgi:nitrate/nitrite transporter NarK